MMGSCCAETADHTQLEDHFCSTKKMEGEEGLNLNTVACLRGRLLAERQASKVAKQEEESMGIKLVDLEKLLREEIKLRDKAERKLKFLKRKLESFNKSSKSGQLGHSDSSEICENSCGSSSISSDLTYESKNHAKNSALQENVVHNHNISPSTTKDCDCQITDSSSSNSSPQILSENPNPSYETEDLKNDESRLSSLSTKSTVTDNESDRADFFDNSMALVPLSMTMTATSQATSNHKFPVNQSVYEALDALRLAKERLQTSLETRQMIHVGLI